MVRRAGGPAFPRSAVPGPNTECQPSPSGLAEHMTVVAFSLKGFFLVPPNGVMANPAWHSSVSLGKALNTPMSKASGTWVAYCSRPNSQPRSKATSVSPATKAEISKFSLSSGLTIYVTPAIFATSDRCSRKFSCTWRWLSMIVCCPQAPGMSNLAPPPNIPPRGVIIPKAMRTSQEVISRLTQIGTPRLE